MSLKTHLALQTLPAAYQKMVLAQHPELKPDNVVPFKTIQDALVGKPMADTWLRVAAPNLLRSPEDAQALAEVAKKVYQTVEAPAARSPASATEASAVSNAPSTQAAPSKVFKGELKWESDHMGGDNYGLQLTQLGDGKLAAVCVEGDVCVYNLGSPQPSWRSVKDRNGPLRSVVPTATGQLLVAKPLANNSDSCLAVVSPNDPSQWANYVWATLPHGINKLALLHDGRIAAAGDDGTLTVYFSNTKYSSSSMGGVAWESEPTGRGLESIVSMNNGHIAAGTNNGFVCVFDPAQPSGSPPIWHSPQHQGRIDDVLQLKNGLLAAACENGSLYLYDPTQPLGSPPVYSVAVNARGLRCLAELPDGTLAVAGGSGTLYLLDLKPSKPGGPVRGKVEFSGLITDLRTLADGNLAVACYDGHVRIFE